MSPSFIYHGIDSHRLPDWTFCWFFVTASAYGNMHPSRRNDQPSFLFYTTMPAAVWSQLDY